MSLIKGISSALDGIGEGVRSFANHSANAAAKANAVSAGAQTAAGNFNQASANNANTINAQTIANQYGYNTGAASLANDFTNNSWSQAAAWNEEMFNRQMEFNAEQAKIQREWSEKMDNTKYQRAMADMKAGGLNPILAYGGINSSASGSAASVSAPEMGFAHGAQATGGLIGANDASISGYNGQMEYMGGMLGLLSAGLNGLGTALKVFGENDAVKNSDFLDFIGEILKEDKSAIKWRTNQSTASKFKNEINSLFNHNKWENGDYNPADEYRYKR